MASNHPKIPFIKFPDVAIEIRAAINEVLHSGIYFNGTFTQKFTAAFSSYLKLNYCLPTANCTDSLEIILRAKGIGEGDEVIVPAFTWFSDASVVETVGAKVVFADIETSHFGMSLNDLKTKVTQATKALIVVHLYGIVHPDIDQIKEMCAKNNIILIEDCAQAHGASLNGHLAGTFGDVAAFSFYPTKNLGALGDAGAILTNNVNLFEKCYLWANHGQKGRNEHIQIGKNSRMDELQAAVLFTKLPKLDAENKKRRELAKIYFYELRHLPITLPSNKEGHVYHQFVIMTEQRDALRTFLNEKHIETDIHYPQALVSMRPFKNIRSENFKNASKAADTVLSLPIHPAHSSEDILMVCEQINSFFKK